MGREHGVYSGWSPGLMFIGVGDRRAKLQAVPKYERTHTNRTK